MRGDFMSELLSSVRVSQADGSFLLIDLGEEDDDWGSRISRNAEARRRRKHWHRTGTDSR